MNMQNKEIRLPDYVTAIIDKMADAGEEIYVVGGSLRDILLGKIPFDYDMTTSATPERVCEILKDFKIIKTGLAHGTQTVLSAGNPIEVTTYRVDGEYRDSRRPESVSFTRSLSKDLARRDFTVNAMAYSPREGFVDLYGGEDDLRAKTIRAVGEPYRRFEEDALRIMRAFRFSAQLGFEIEDNTLGAAISCKDRLGNIAKERIGAEFIKLVCSDSPVDAVMQMRDTGVLDYALGGFFPSDLAIQLLTEVENTDVARLSCLLFEAEEDEITTSLSMLKCSNKQKTGARAIIRGAKRKTRSDFDAAKLCADVGEYAKAAAKLSVLRGISPNEALSLVGSCHAPRNLGDLAIRGADLAELSLKGKEIGEMLEYLFELTLKNPELNTEDELLRAAKEKQNLIRRKGE